MSVGKPVSFCLALWEVCSLFFLLPQPHSHIRLRFLREVSCWNFFLPESNPPGELNNPLIAQLVKNRLQCRRPWFNSWVGKTHWRRDRLPTPIFLDFPCGSAGKESTCKAGEGKGYPLQVFWPGEFHGLYNPWGCKELDTTEWLSLFHVILMCRQVANH